VDEVGFHREGAAFDLVFARHVEVELFQGVGAAVHGQGVAAFGIIDLNGVAVVFHFHGAGAVIGFDGRQAAGNGFGNVDGRLVFAGGAQAELFGQIAPAFGGIVPCVAPMGVVAVCGGRERGECRQHDGGQAG